MHRPSVIPSWQHVQPASIPGAHLRGKSAQGLQARECVVIPGKMPGPDRPLVGLGSPVRMAEASHAFLAAWQSPCRGQPTNAPQPTSPQPPGSTPQPTSPIRHPVTRQMGTISISGHSDGHCPKLVADQANQAAGLLKTIDGEVSATAAAAIGAGSTNKAEACSWVQPGMQAAAAGTGCSDAELSQRVAGGMSLLSQSTPELPKAAHSRAALRYANLDTLPDTDFDPAAALVNDAHTDSGSLRHAYAVPEGHQPKSSNLKPPEQQASMHAGAWHGRRPQPMPNLLQAGTGKQQQAHQGAGSGAEPVSPSVHPGFRMSVPPATPASISPILERAAGRLTPGSARALERMRALHMQRKSGTGIPPGSPLDTQFPTQRDVSSAFEAAAGLRPSRLRHQASVGPTENANKGDDRTHAGVSVVRGDQDMQQAQAQHGAAADQAPASNLAQKLRESEAQSNGSQKRNPDPAGVSTPQRQKKARSGRSPQIPPQLATGNAWDDQENIPQNASSPPRSRDASAKSSPTKFGRQRAPLKTAHQFPAAASNPSGSHASAETNLQLKPDNSGSSQHVGGRSELLRMAGSTRQAAKSGDPNLQTLGAMREGLVPPGQSAAAAVADGAASGSETIDGRKDGSPQVEAHDSTQAGLDTEKAGGNQRLLGTPALWHSILLRQGMSLPEADQDSPMLHRPLAAGLLHARQVAGPLVMWPKNLRTTTKNITKKTYRFD